MIVIRQNQFAAMAVTQGLVNDMVNHLRQQFPAQMAGKSDQALREHARVAATEARAYGLKGRWDQLRFLNLGTLAGLGWSQDTALQWMDDTMRDSAVGNPSQRLKHVLERYLLALESQEAFEQG